MGWGTGGALGQRRRLAKPCIPGNDGRRMVGAEGEGGEREGRKRETCHEEDRGNALQGDARVDGGGRKAVVDLRRQSLRQSLTML